MKTRILIIDDDDLVRSTLARMLMAAGFEVIEAADGDEGLRKNQGGNVDLVITDIMMPEKDGLETIRGLRLAGTEAKIIAISGGGLGGKEIYLGMAEKLGADGVLAKPIRQRDLLTKIDAVLAVRAPLGVSPSAADGTEIDRTDYPLQ